MVETEARPAVVTQASTTTMSNNGIKRKRKRFTFLQSKILADFSLFSGDGTLTIDGSTSGLLGGTIAECPKKNNKTTVTKSNGLVQQSNIQCFDVLSEYAGNKTGSGGGCCVGLLQRSSCSIKH
jgi:hypothetical protein